MLGLQVVVSEHALQDSDVRLFPESKNRSRRIRKKLIKRFGGEFKKVPAIFQFGDRLLAHPAIYHELRRHIADARQQNAFGERLFA